MGFVGTRALLNVQAKGDIPARVYGQGGKVQDTVNGKIVVKTVGQLTAVANGKTFYGACTYADVIPDGAFCVYQGRYGGKTCRAELNVTKDPKSFWIWLRFLDPLEDVILTGNESDFDAVWESIQIDYNPPTSWADDAVITPGS